MKARMQAEVLKYQEVRKSAQLKDDNFERDKKLRTVNSQLQSLQNRFDLYLLALINQGMIQARHNVEKSSVFQERTKDFTPEERQ